jgi:hypothetical protein
MATYTYTTIAHSDRVYDTRFFRPLQRYTTIDPQPGEVVSSSHHVLSGLTYVDRHVHCTEQPISLMRKTPLLRRIGAFVDRAQNSSQDHISLPAAGQPLAPPFDAASARKP